MLLLLSPTRRREHRLVQTLYRKILEAGFSVIRNSYDVRPNSTRSDKYLNLWSTLPEAVRQARRLGLLDSHGLRILDLGCGAGCFLYAARSFGHDVLGLDVDTDPVYNDMTRILRVPRITHTIRPFESLPNFGPPFDLITAFSICFDCHDSRDIWLEDQWAFFLNDCRRRLTPRGRLYFQFNPATRQDFDFLPDGVAAMMRRLPGATLSRSKEFLLIQT